MWLHRFRCTRACADDAAVAITCACACNPPVYIANAHVMYMHISIYIYMDRCKVRACKWVRECVRSAIHRWNAHSQCMYTRCMHASTSMRVLLHRRTDRRCAPAALTRPRAVSVRARVRSGAHASAPTHASAFPSAVDRGWLGAQAFQAASAFNANIGAWNTARVTTLQWVCAFSAGGTPRGGSSVDYEVSYLSQVYPYLHTCNF